MECNKVVIPVWTGVGVVSAQCQNAKFYVDFCLIYVILCSFKQTNPTVSHHAMDFQVYNIIPNIQYPNQENVLEKEKKLVILCSHSHLHHTVMVTVSKINCRPNSLLQTIKDPWNESKFKGF